MMHWSRCRRQEGMLAGEIQIGPPPMQAPDTGEVGEDSHFSTSITLYLRNSARGMCLLWKSNRNLYALLSNGAISSDME